MWGHARVMVCGNMNDGYCFIFIDFWIGIHDNIKASAKTLQIFSLTPQRTLHRNNPKDIQFNSMETMLPERLANVKINYSWKLRDQQICLLLMPRLASLE